MARCSDNPVLGRIGCGQTFGRETQHSVARVSWSRFPDGISHVTASLSVIDECWAKGKGEMADPATLGFVQDERGRWRRPLTAAGRALFDAKRAGKAATSRQGAAQTGGEYSDGTQTQIGPSSEWEDD